RNLRRRDRPQRRRGGRDDETRFCRAGSAPNDQPGRGYLRLSSLLFAPQRKTPAGESQRAFGICLKDDTSAENEPSQTALCCQCWPGVGTTNCLTQKQPVKWRL